MFKFYFSITCFRSTEENADGTRVHFFQTLQNHSNYKTSIHFLSKYKSPQRNEHTCIGKIRKLPGETLELCGYSWSTNHLLCQMSNKEKKCAFVLISWCVCFCLHVITIFMLDSNLCFLRRRVEEVGGISTCLYTTAMLSTSW